MSEIPDLGDPAHLGAAGATTGGNVPVEEAESRYQGRFGAIRSLRHHAARGVIVNSAYQIGLSALRGVRGVAAAAFLTAGEYGIWGLLALSLLAILVLKGIGVNEKYVQQSEEDQELAFQRGFTLELIFAAVSLPVVAGIVCGISLVTGHPELIPPGLVLTLMVLGLALQFPVWGYYRRMDFRRQRILQGVDPVLATVVTIVLAALGFGYWSLVIGSVAGAALGAIGALVFSPYPLRLTYDRGTLRDYLGFSAPIAIGGLCGLSTFFAIYLTGNAAIGLVGLGVFTLVGNLLQFTNKADAVISETLYPALCAVQDRIDTLHEAFVKSNRLALMWAAPFGIGLSLFAADLVHFVLGDQWEAAIGLLQVMGVLTAVHHVGFNWFAFYRARGETRPVAVHSVLVAGAMIAVSVPLMFELGITGIALGYVAAEAVSLVVRGHYLTTLFEGFQPLRHLVRALMPTALAAALILGLRAVGASGGAGFALIEVGLFLGATAILTWVFERGLIRETIGYFGSRARIGPAPQGADAPARG